MNPNSPWPMQTMSVAEWRERFAERCIDAHNEYQLLRLIESAAREVLAVMETGRQPPYTALRRAIAEKDEHARIWKQVRGIPDVYYGDIES